jgi:hypothetical protein
MYRFVKVPFSQLPNSIIIRGKLIANQNIRRGEPIRIYNYKKRPIRSAQERSELNRLACVAYEHALKN